MTRRFLSAARKVRHAARVGRAGRPKKKGPTLKMVSVRLREDEIARLHEDGDRRARERNLRKSDYSEIIRELIDEKYGLTAAPEERAQSAKK